MFLGKYKGGNIISYFDKIFNIGFLLFYPEYFVKKDKIKILDEYIYYKFLLESYDIKTKQTFLYKRPLEEFISAMNKKVNSCILQNRIKQFKAKVKQKINLLSKKHLLEPEKISISKIKKLSENESVSININSN